MTPPPAAPAFSVTSITFHHAVVAARRAGIPSAALAGVIGPSDAAPELEVRVPFDRLVALWELILDASGDEASPILAARDAQTDTHSLLTCLCLAQPTLGKAMELFSRHSWMVTDAYGWEVRDEGDLAALVHVPRAPVDRRGVRAAIEFDVADLLLLLSATTGGRVAPVEVVIGHAPPRDPGRHCDLLGVPARFDAPATAIRVDRASLEVPLVGSNPGLAAVLAHQLARLTRLSGTSRGARTPDGGSSLAARVRVLLETNLPVRAVSAGGAARALGFGERTFARRLGDEGTSFRALLDEVRCELARRWLREAKADVIAERLGYADPRAFRRAFHRWTGETPRAYRRAAR